MTRQGKPTPFATYLKCFAKLTKCSWLTQSSSLCSENPVLFSRPENVILYFLSMYYNTFTGFSFDFFFMHIEL